MPKEKTRLDELLVTRGLAENTAHANALIMSGVVIVNEHKVTKSGEKFAVDAEIYLTRAHKKYASRGALKLEGALKQFSVSPENKICLDVGASTGGFTDILLQNGAKKVYAFDVGYGQMISRLRKNSKVVVRDRFNIKNITPDDIDGHSELLIAIDVSFISLKPVLHALARLKAKSGKIHIIALLKPQFEAKESELENGIVKSGNARFRIVKNILRFIKSEIQGKVTGLAKSAIRGKDGNQEFFISILL